MKIKIKLMGMLKEKTPEGGDLELSSHPTILGALELLGIDPESVQAFSVNGSIERDKTRELQEADELVVLPPVGGG